MMTGKMEFELVEDGTVIYNVNLDNCDIVSSMAVLYAIARTLNITPLTMCAVAKHCQEFIDKNYGEAGYEPIFLDALMFSSRGYTDED